MSTKALAAKADRRGKKRMMDNRERRGKQVAHAEFRKYLEAVHSQACYGPIAMTEFRIPGDMEGRLEKEIRKAGSKRTSGTYVIHAEMLQVTPEKSASLLYRWWEAFGRTGVPRRMERRHNLPAVKKGRERGPGQLPPGLSTFPPEENRGYRHIFNPVIQVHPSPHAIRLPGGPRGNASASPGRRKCKEKNAPRKSIGPGEGLR